MDYNLPGSSVHEIFQARILERVAISFSRGSFWPQIEPVTPESSEMAGGFFTTCATWEAPSWKHGAQEYSRFQNPPVSNKISS